MQPYCLRCRCNSPAGKVIFMFIRTGMSRAASGLPTFERTKNKQNEKISRSLPRPAGCYAANREYDTRTAGSRNQAWMTWAQNTGDKLVDMGAPLMNGQQLNVDGSSTSSTKNVCGYSVVQAENMDEAKALLKGHPHLSGWHDECSIEVHETVKLPGM